MVLASSTLLKPNSLNFMAKKQFTLVGRTTLPGEIFDTEIYVHIESATTAENARTQFEAHMGASAAFTVYPGHIHSEDQASVLRVLSGGRMYDRSVALLPDPSVDARTAAVINGIKVTMVLNKGVPRWVVQHEENRLSERTLGDTTHATLAEAVTETTKQVERVQAKKDRFAAIDFAASDAFFKKDVNDNRSRAEFMRDAWLDGPTRFHANAGLGTGYYTQRQSLRLAIADGRFAKAVQVAGASFSRTGLEVKGTYQFRLYDGVDDKGDFREITKIDYDFIREERVVESIAISTYAVTGQRICEILAMPGDALIVQDLAAA